MGNLRGAWATWRAGPPRTPPHATPARGGAHTALQGCHCQGLSHTTILRDLCKSSTCEFYSCNPSPLRGEGREGVIGELPGRGTLQRAPTSSSPLPSSPPKGWRPPNKWRTSRTFSLKGGGELGGIYRLFQRSR
jgi:hypothetical protein